MSVKCVVPALAGVLMLAGCVSSPVEPSFGELLGGRAQEFQSLQADWKKGSALEAKGQSQLARGKERQSKGEKLVAEGQKLIEQAKKDVREGESRVAEGARLKQSAEAGYRSVRESAPLLPEAPVQP